MNAIFFRGLLEKNCTEKGGTVVRKKRHLLSKPSHHLPTSVTISITPAGNHNTALYTKSALNREPDVEEIVENSNCLQQSSHEQLHEGTSQQSTADTHHPENRLTSQNVKKDTLNLPYTKNRISSTSSDKQSDSSVANGNQTTVTADEVTKPFKKKCKKKKRKSMNGVF